MPEINKVCFNNHGDLFLHVLEFLPSTIQKVILQISTAGPDWLKVIIMGILYLLETNKTCEIFSMREAENFSHIFTSAV